MFWRRVTRMGDRKEPTPQPPAPLPRIDLRELSLLGLKVRDKVTGMTGVCESISYDLYGCIQAVVRGLADDKGQVPDGRWFDVSRLDVIDHKPVMQVPGGRFVVSQTSPAPGPTEKPPREGRPR